MKKLIFVILLFCNTVFAQNYAENNLAISKFDFVMRAIFNNYVDSVNSLRLSEEAIIAVLKSLDPHSVYFNKEEAEAVNQPLDGSYEGIGVHYQIWKDSVYVVSVFPKSPAEKAGILAGDRIVKIDSIPVSNVKITSKQVKKYIGGNVDTKVNLTIKRKEMKDNFVLTAVRAKLPDYSIDASYMVTENVGYIKLIRFARTSTDEFTEAFNKLKKQGLKYLIFDLSNNGGGYLNVATDLVDQFLPESKIITYTEGYNSPRFEYFSTDRGIFEKGKLVVMLDEGSASASEIFAGAIQDWDRGILVGRRSYGKGLVQRSYYMADGSMIRLTISRYFTPSGRCIQKSYKKGVSEYKNDVKNRLKSGELFHRDSIHINDSLKYFTKDKNRKVYGGGGIIPDVFVSLDTAQFPTFYNKWYENGIVISFVISYIDENRKFLHKNYPNFDKFYKTFQISDEFLNDLQIFAQKEMTRILKEKKDTLTKVPANYDFANYKSVVKTELKARIARNVWGINEFYMVVNEINPLFLKSVEILRQKNEYESVFNLEK